MQRTKSGGGLRSMRRIPVALTREESSALHWLKHFARAEQLPRNLRKYRKKALHISIKALSADDLRALVAAFEVSLTPPPKNAHAGAENAPEIVQQEFDFGR